MQLTLYLLVIIMAYTNYSKVNDLSTFLDMIRKIELTSLSMESGLYNSSQWICTTQYLLDCVQQLDSARRGREWREFENANLRENFQLVYTEDAVVRQ